MGPAYLTSVLQNNGYHVDIFHGTAYHLGPNDLARYLTDRPQYDFIGIGFLTNYVHYVIKYCDAIRETSPRSKIILGSNGYSALPAFYIHKTNADYGVSGEAENSLLNLLNRLVSREDVRTLPSVSGKCEDQIFVSKTREPVPDINSLPLPAYDKFPMEKYFRYVQTGYHRGEKEATIISSRGCPYTCNFCFRQEEGHRYRNFSDMVEEFNLLSEKYSVSRFWFVDELFMTSKKHVINFCNQLADAMDQGVIPRFTWETTGRFNVVNEDVCRAMANAGCTSILYGLESGDEYALQVMGKNTTVEMIENGIALTKKAGMNVWLPCMFGNIGETEDSINKTVDLLIKHSPAEKRTLRPVTPYPGTPLYQYALDKGLIKDHEEFFNISKNPDLLTVNFTEMSDDDFFRVLFEANVKLLDVHYERRKAADVKGFERLYFHDDDSELIIEDRSPDPEF